MIRLVLTPRVTRRSTEVSVQRSPASDTNDTKPGPKEAARLPESQSAPELVDSSRTAAGASSSSEPGGGQEEPGAPSER